MLDSKFISQTEQTLESIKEIVNNQVVIIGFPRKKINQLFNSAAIINEGEIIGYHDKILLPTYDEFDENSYMMNGIYGGETFDDYFMNMFEDKQMSVPQRDKQFLKLMRMMEPLFLVLKRMS